MPIAVIMPKQGQSVETCIITKWFKTKGESVSVGDILFSYETDKAAFDLESTSDGILLDIFFGEGAEVPVLVNVAVIGKTGEVTYSFNPDQTTQSEVPASKVSTIEPVKAKEALNLNNLLSASDGKIRISPRAKRLAEGKGINYSNFAGSGPNGRIITIDIEKVLSGAIAGTKTVQKTGDEFTEKPLSNVRKLIAKAMYASLQN